MPPVSLLASSMPVMAGVVTATCPSLLRTGLIMVCAFTAGVCEMLLQSHLGEIHLLPALPKTWPTGSVTGLRARGGFTVDVAWKDGALSAATIRSTLGQPVRVRLGDKLIERPMSVGQKNRERARPFRHPAHRHTAQEASTRSLEGVARSRVLLDEGSPLIFVERFQPSAVGGLTRWHGELPSVARLHKP